MINVKTSGSFKNSNSFLNKILRKQTIEDVLNHYGRIGVDALSSNTPTNTGLTARSWRYELHYSKGKRILWFTNDNIVNGIPVAILIQLSHGTKNGGFVQGYDYINPVIRPLFDKIANDAWKEVTA